MSALPKHHMTVEEYLAMDRVAEVKSEYHDGEVFPVVAGTVAHARLVANVAIATATDAKKKKCRVHGPLRVQVAARKYVYPDIALTCGPAVPGEDQLETITNPRAIFEVLSPSTADYDRGGKFSLYQRLPSFEEYFLVEQDQPKVTAYRKQSPQLWTMEIVTGMEAMLTVQTLDAQIPLADIFADIAFPPAEE